MIETILTLLFLGAIIFVATTGERSDDKKEDDGENQGKKD